MISGRCFLVFFDVPCRGIHCLRKGYGTNLANLGIPAHTLKEMMGHSSIGLFSLSHRQECSEGKKGERGGFGDNIDKSMAITIEGVKVYPRRYPRFQCSLLLENLKSSSLCHHR